MKLSIPIRSLLSLVASFTFVATSALAQGQSQSQSGKQDQKQTQAQTQTQTQTQTQQQQLQDEKVTLTPIHNLGFPLEVTDAEVIQQGKGVQAAEIVDVRVEVTYSNSCLVADTDQVVELRTETDTTINIQLLEFFDRRDGAKICPFIFAPVTVDYVIEDLRISDDGGFKELIINGMSVN